MTDITVHVPNMGPTWVLLAPGGPHVGPMKLAIMVLNIHETKLCVYPAICWADTQTFAIKVSESHHNNDNTCLFDSKLLFAQAWPLHLVCMCHGVRVEWCLWLYADVRPKSAS